MLGRRRYRASRANQMPSRKGGRRGFALHPMPRRGRPTVQSQPWAAKRPRGAGLEAAARVFHRRRVAQGADIAVRARWMCYQPVFSATGFSPGLPVEATPTKRPPCHWPTVQNCSMTWFLNVQLPSTVLKLFFLM